MPVDVRPERCFGIVGVDHVHIVQPQDSGRLRDGFLQTGLRRNIVTRSEQMTGIQAKTYWQIRHLRRKFADRRQLFEPPADLRARAHGAFGQEHQFAELQTGGCLRDSLQKTEDALFHRLTLVISRMGHQKFGTDGDGAFEFAAEGLHRLRPDDFVHCRQIDQIIVVDHQRR